MRDTSSPESDLARAIAEACGRRLAGAPVGADGHQGMIEAILREVADRARPASHTQDRARGRALLARALDPRSPAERREIKAATGGELPV